MGQKRRKDRNASRVLFVWRPRCPRVQRQPSRVSRKAVLGREGARQFSGAMANEAHVPFVCVSIEWIAGGSGGLPGVGWGELSGRRGVRRFTSA